MLLLSDSATDELLEKRYGEPVMPPFKINLESIDFQGFEKSFKRKMSKAQKEETYAKIYDAENCYYEGQMIGGKR
jgi:hypothetical protein